MYSEETSNPALFRTAVLSTIHQYNRECSHGIGHEMTLPASE